MRTKQHTGSNDSNDKQTQNSNNTNAHDTHNATNTLKTGRLAVSALKNDKVIKNILRNKNSCYITNSLINNPKNIISNIILIH